MAACSSQCDSRGMSSNLEHALPLTATTEYGVSPYYLFIIIYYYTESYVKERTGAGISCDKADLPK